MVICCCVASGGGGARFRRNASQIGLTIGRDGTLKEGPPPSGETSKKI
jgi:hypothetical protein